MGDSAMGKLVLKLLGKYLDVFTLPPESKEQEKHHLVLNTAKRCAELRGIRLNPAAIQEILVLPPNIAVVNATCNVLRAQLPPGVPRGKNIAKQPVVITLEGLFVDLLEPGAVPFDVIIDDDNEKNGSGKESVDMGGNGNGNVNDSACPLEALPTPLKDSGLFDMKSTAGPKSFGNKVRDTMSLVVTDVRLRCGFQEHLLIFPDTDSGSVPRSKSSSDADSSSGDKRDASRSGNVELPGADNEAEGISLLPKRWARPTLEFALSDVSIRSVGEQFQTVEELKLYRKESSDRTELHTFKVLSIGSLSATVIGPGGRSVPILDELPLVSRLTSRWRGPATPKRSLLPEGTWIGGIFDIIFDKFELSMSQSSWFVVLGLVHCIKRCFRRPLAEPAKSDNLKGKKKKTTPSASSSSSSSKNKFDPPLPPPQLQISFELRSFTASIAEDARDGVLAPETAVVAGTNVCISATTGTPVAPPSPTSPSASQGKSIDATSNLGSTNNAEELFRTAWECNLPSISVSHSCFTDGTSVLLRQSRDMSSANMVSLTAFWVVTRSGLATSQELEETLKEMTVNGMLMGVEVNANARSWLGLSRLLGSPRLSSKQAEALNQPSADEVDDELTKRLEEQLQLQLKAVQDWNDIRVMLTCTNMSVFTPPTTTYPFGSDADPTDASLRLNLGSLVIMSHPGWEAIPANSSSFYARPAVLADTVPGLGPLRSLEAKSDAVQESRTPTHKRPHKTQTSVAKHDRLKQLERHRRSVSVPDFVGLEDEHSATSRSASRGSKISKSGILHQLATAKENAAEKYRSAVATMDEAERFFKGAVKAGSIYRLEASMQRVDVTLEARSIDNAEVVSCDSVRLFYRYEYGERADSSKPLLQSLSQVTSHQGNLCVDLLPCHVRIIQGILLHHQEVLRDEGLMWQDGTSDLAKGFRESAQRRLREEAADLDVGRLVAAVTQVGHEVVGKLESMGNTPDKQNSGESEPLEVHKYEFLIRADLGSFSVPLDMETAVDAEPAPLIELKDFHIGVAYDGPLEQTVVVELREGYADALTLQDRVVVRRAAGDDNAHVRLYYSRGGTFGSELAVSLNALQVVVAKRADSMSDSARLAESSSGEESGTRQALGRAAAGDWKTMVDKIVSLIDSKREGVLAKLEEVHQAQQDALADLAESSDAFGAAREVQSELARLTDEAKKLLQVRYVVRTSNVEVLVFDERAAETGGVLPVGRIGFLQTSQTTQENNLVRTLRAQLEDAERRAAENESRFITTKLALSEAQMQVQDGERELYYARNKR